MAFISLGKINNNQIPILIGCLFCFLNRLLNQYDGTLLYKNLILTNIFISLSGVFAIIPFIILKKRSQRVKNIDIDNRKTNNTKIEYIYTDYGEENVQGKFRFILLSAIIFFIQSIFFVASFKIKSNSWILFISFASLFYYIIFKIKLYNHHYLSIILIILIGVIIDLVSENLQNDISDNLPSLLMRFIREVLFSFFNVIIKYVMEKKYVSVYEMTFYNGIINFILFGISAIIDFYFFNNNNNYEEYFNDFNIKELLVILGVMGTQLGLNLSSIFTIKKNSPCHAFIILVFGQFAYYVNFEGYSILIIIGLIFILFLSLIFNEIVEINFWGLSRNTKNNISSRAESKEDFLIDNNDTFDENDERDENSVELGNNETHN